MALPEAVTIFMFVKLAVPSVMNLGPTIVAGCSAAAGAAAGGVVAAAAVDTGAAIAIVVTATATAAIRRVRVGLMSYLPFDLCYGIEACQSFAFHLAEDFGMTILSLSEIGFKGSAAKLF
jgi:hypothetical protein